MTLRHMAHQLTCPDCAAALEGNPPQLVPAAQCTLILNGDQDPPTLCPHPRDGDSYWCEFHAEAMGEQVKLDGEAAELAQAIAAADARIAAARAQLRAFDRDLKVLRSFGTPRAEIVTLKMRREELTTAIARSIASKAELEVRLEVLRPPDDQG